MLSQLLLQKQNVPNTQSTHLGKQLQCYLRDVSTCKAATDASTAAMGWGTSFATSFCLKDSVRYGTVQGDKDITTY
jgi:hypothetical protein